MCFKFPLLQKSTQQVCAFSLVVAAFASSLALPLESLAQTKKSPFADGPKTIASRERVSVLIDREIADGKKYIVLKISVPTDSQVKAFLLPDPPRVVVDFEGASVKKSEEFLAPENDVIKQVRLGAHPSKIRFVLDMRRSTPPEYEWKAGKRQAILRFYEGPAEVTPAAAPAAAAGAAPAPALPTAAPTAALSPTTIPSAAPTTAATSAPTTAPSTAPTTPPTATSTATPSVTPQTTLSDIEPKIPAEQKAAVAGAAAAGAAAQGAAAAAANQAAADLGDLENGQPQPKVPTTFSIKGYKFEYLPDKTPALKIVLNKPRAQAQISKVDEETYKIEIKDCGIDNEDLELPQFPPHDFVGFVMVVAETIGKNTEVSISIEEDIVLGTSVHENEIWVKKP
jgi:hypothetical protein